MKWILPSEETFKKSMLIQSNDKSLTEDEMRINALRDCCMQDKSDLTDALDILDELNRRFPTKIINDFLNKFRSHK